MCSMICEKSHGIGMMRKVFVLTCESMQTWYYQYMVSAEQGYFDKAISIFLTSFHSTPSLAEKKSSSRKNVRRFLFSALMESVKLTDSIKYSFEWIVQQSEKLFSKFEIFYANVCLKLMLMVKHDIARMLTTAECLPLLTFMLSENIHLHWKVRIMQTLRRHSEKDSIKFFDKCLFIQTFKFFSHKLDS